jgi:hypothetical protein
MKVNALTTVKQNYESEGSDLGVNQRTMKVKAVDLGLSREL